MQTATALDRHVDFGAWFAAIAAGYLLSSLPSRRVVLAVSVAAWIPVTSMDMAQAHAMIDWPDVTGLVKVVRAMTAHGGHCRTRRGGDGRTPRTTAPLLGGGPPKVSSGKTVFDVREYVGRV
jgi:hypothetical protein